MTSSNNNISGSQGIVLSVSNRLRSLLPGWTYKNQTLRSIGDLIWYEATVQYGIMGPEYTFGFNSLGAVSGSPPPQIQSRLAKDVLAIPRLIESKRLKW